MTTKARIVRFAAPGGPEVLKLETIDLPDPGPGEVQVRQSAVGLNFQEIYQRSGFYPMPLPAGLGNEAAGVVLKAGPGNPYAGETHFTAIFVTSSPTACSRPLMASAMNSPPHPCSRA